MQKDSTSQKQMIKRLATSAILSLLAFFAFLYIYRTYASKAYQFPDHTVQLYPSDNYLYGVYNAALDSDGVLIPANNDPQILFLFDDPQTIQSVRIKLDVAVNENCSVDIYFAKENESLSEAQVVRGYIFSGKNEQFFSLPPNNYSVLRIDINGNVDIETIEISENPLQDKNKGKIILLSFLLSIVIFFITLRYPNKAKKKKALSMLRDYFSIPCLNNHEKGYLLLCFFIYIFWALTFTSWSYGPDEQMRYDIPKFIFENGALPIGNEESIRNPIWGFSYGFDINLPYITSACFMWAMSLFSSNATMLLYAARLTSVLSTVGAAYFAILFSKKIMGNNPVRWVFISLISLLPQIVFLASYVNLDSFSLFTIMMIVNFWYDCIATKWGKPSIVLLSIGLGLCFLSYKFAYSYIFVTLFIYIAWHIINRKETSMKEFLKKGLMILAIVFVVCGWKFIRNAVLYEGDFLSLHASEPYAELYAINEFKPSNKLTLAEQGVSIGGMLKDNNWIESTYLSMIGIFGYMSTRMDQYFYDIYSFLFIVGGSGFFVRLCSALFRCKKNRISLQTALLFCGMIAASMITIGISVYMSWAIDYQPQGRYLLAIMPALFMAVSLGLDQWLSILSNLKSAVGLDENKTERIQSGSAKLIFLIVLITGFIGYVSCIPLFVGN